ncbi:MAG: DUF3105 domain-containing protein [Anaerolineae bacterium]
MARKQTALPKSKRGRAARQQPRQRIPVWVWFVGGGVLAVLLVAGLFYLGIRDRTQAAESNLVPSNLNSGEIEGLVIYPDPGAGHQEGDIAYNQEVPPGGPHNAALQNCGIYDEPVRAENVLHSLEHGAVWIAYRPDLPENQVEFLREVVRQERRTRRQALIVLAPKPDLSVPIVATAWRAQLELEDATDERLLLFVSRFQKGPFTPEPGASCGGGTGRPRS